MAIVLNNGMASVSSVHCLIVYVDAPREIEDEAISISALLAEQILSINPNRRSLRLPVTFSKVLDGLPGNPIIKNIDVLFNPAYQVDVLTLLENAFRRKAFRLIWPGKYMEGKLFYSEEGYEDYRVFDIDKYNIVCVINQED